MYNVPQGFLRSRDRPLWLCSSAPPEGLAETVNPRPLLTHLAESRGPRGTKKWPLKEGRVHPSNNRAQPQTAMKSHTVRQSNLEMAFCWTSENENLTRVHTVTSLKTTAAEVLKLALRGSGWKGERPLWAPSTGLRPGSKRGRAEPFQWGERSVPLHVSRRHFSATADPRHVSGG